MFLEPHLLSTLALIALFIGFLKAGVPVLGGICTVIMAFIVPPRDAVGLTLLYLLVGDFCAISLFWRDARWAILKKMLPAILLGMVLGGAILSVMSNEWLGVFLGALVVTLVLLEPLRARLTEWSQRHEKPVRVGSGLLAGFATVAGNQSGAILTIYFLLLKIDKKAFVGTAALFYVIVNSLKVPIYAVVGIFDLKYLASFAVTAPLVVLGAVYGKKFVQWIPQEKFNRLALSMTLLGGVVLFVCYLLQVIRIH